MGAEHMGEKALTVLVRQDGVAVIRCDLPGEPVSARRASFAEELEQALGRIAQDSKVRAAVLTSGREGTFVVGRTSRCSRG